MRSESIHNKTIQDKRVLFVSSELIAADIAYQLKKQGCSVKLYINNKSDKSCFDGIVEKTKNWREELAWVGKDGLIVFDDVGFGEDQEKLRKKGYHVVGGSKEGDRLEMDRAYGQKILRDYGVIKGNDFETKHFTVDDAIKYIKRKKGCWVIKQDDHNTSLNYISALEDGSDAISVLLKYKEAYSSHNHKFHISIQRRVHGVEIAIGRFFNGKNWTGPLVINKEHKHVFDDGIGPLGGESGTLMRYESNEDTRLFKETLDKIRPHLEKSSYKGYIDINCIILDSKRIFPLEITSRFGSSTNETQSEIHKSPWFDFLMAVAKGEAYSLDYSKGYAINAAITVPPFPYILKDNQLSQKGVGIFFSKSLTQEEFSSIHFEEVSLIKRGNKSSYIISGNSGYILYVTSVARSVKLARKRVYDIIEKIHIPKMFYRTDIGVKFMKEDHKKLKNWGWI